MSGAMSRLGDVLYWAGNIVSLILFAGATWVLIDTGDRRLGFFIFVFAPAILVWVVGRACRYVLSDR